MTPEQLFLVEHTGSTETASINCLAELERTADILNGKPGDPGFMNPINKRVAAVCAKLALLAKEAEADVLYIDEHDHAENVRQLVSFRPGDPGHLYPIHERVAGVIAELEKRLAKAEGTLEAIGRTECFS